MTQTPTPTPTPAPPAGPDPATMRIPMLVHAAVRDAGADRPWLIVRNPETGLVWWVAERGGAHIVGHVADDGEGALTEEATHETREAAEAAFKDLSGMYL